MLPKLVNRLVIGPVCAISAAIGLASAALAQESDAYERLVLAVASDAIAELVFETEMQVGFVGALKQDPNVMETEAECPGLVSGMTDAVMPVMRKSHALDYDWYRGELDTLFRASMTKTEAAQAAEFFSSDLAQRFLATAIRQSSADNVIEDLMTNDSDVVTKEAYAADKEETVKRTMEALAPEDLTEFTTRLAGAPWFATFAGLNPRINELGLAMGNRDLTPEHDAEFEAAINAFTQSHFEQCEAPE